MTKDSKRIFGLDVIRSIAILCVLADHWLLSALQGKRTFSSDAWVSFLGMFGVDLFFVLSGYLIGGILIRDLECDGMSRPTIANFWQRRWFRTLPNYYAYFLLAILFARPWKRPMDTIPVLYPFFLQNFAWKMPQFFSLSWSLAVEEWFYLLFPLMIAACGRFFRSNRQSVLAALLLLLLAPTFVRIAMEGNHGLNFVHCIVVCRLDSIAIGVALAFLKKYHATIWRKLSSSATLWAGLVCAALTLAFTLLVNPEYGGTTNRLRDTLYISFMDAACALMLPWFSNLAKGSGLAVSLFTWISILSYSLYLCNQIAIDAAGTIRAKFGIQSFIPLNLFMEMTIAFLMSVGSYVLVEKTFLRMRDSDTRSRPTAPSTADKALKPNAIAGTENQ